MCIRDRRAPTSAPADSTAAAPIASAQPKETPTAGQAAKTRKEQPSRARLAAVADLVLCWGGC
eukprot:6444237-Alexandrium_andersonii.AAC.1